jgi:hypothetical protein
MRMIRILWSIWMIIRRVGINRRPALVKAELKLRWRWRLYILDGFYGVWSWAACYVNCTVFDGKGCLLMGK